LSAVTKAAIGSSTGTITVAGSPTNEYAVAVEITATGDLGAGRFRFRLDYNAAVPAQSTGTGWSPEILIPSGGTYLIPNTGITLTFVPGVGVVYFEDGDLHTFDATADHYAAADVTSFFAALDNQIGSLYIDQCFFTGVSQAGTDAATLAAAVDTAMTGLEGKFYFGRALMDAGSLDTAANVKTAFAAFSSTRVGICYGMAHIVSYAQLVGWGVPKLPLLNAVAERAARGDLSENLGRKKSGALRGVTWISHDEDRLRSFIAADKIITARTHRGESGFYLTNGYLKSPMGSDFEFYDWGRVCDRGARVVAMRQSPWTLAKLRARTDGTGYLTEDSAKRVEESVRPGLKAELLDPINVEGERGHVSGLSYTVSRTTDFLSNRTPQTTLTMVPLPPVEGFETQVGFARSL
jgi:hypothetical protein